MTLQGNAKSPIVVTVLMDSSEQMVHTDQNFNSYLQEPKCLLLQGETTTSPENASFARLIFPNIVTIVALCSFSTQIVAIDVNACTVLNDGIQRVQNHATPNSTM